MSWINTIPFAAAQGRLRRLYDRVTGPDGNVDNIMLAHSLRPHSMEGHMALYKAVLHHSGNQLPKWLLEVLGVHVSLLNGCDYCVEHHAAGLGRLLGDDERHSRIMTALREGEPERVFGGRELAALRYATQLTGDPSAVSAQTLADLRDAGMDDGEILEVNQVTAYFAYANRTVLGLGVTTEGDVLGLSPNDSDDPLNWTHR